MGIDRRRASALAGALAAVLAGACGRTELWPAMDPAGGGASDGGTDVPMAAGDASAPDGSGDAGRPRDPCSAAGTPCGAGQHCVPSEFRRASGVPGGSDLVLVLGDMNHDGLPDLVTLSPSRYNVAVWLNDRTTGFHSAGSYGVTGQPISAAIGDFTGDGVADIAVAAFSGGEVTTLIGAGDGTFRMGSFSTANMQPRAVVATDLDDDGRLDLVVANQDPNRTDDITLLDGLGGGTFQATGRYGTFPSASALAVGDFNGDGKPDVAAVSAAVSSLSVFYHGGFSLPTSRFVESGTRSIAVADFDEDGVDDLAVSGVGSVAIFPGSHSTVLGTGPVLSTGAVMNGTASAVTAGDFDGDGHVDLAFADGTQLYLFPGTGAGQFQPARALLTAGNDTQPSQLAAADLDGDGVSDLLVGSVGGQILPLLSNAGNLLVPATAVPLTGSPVRLASGDFDGDGNADLAVTQWNAPDGALVLLGDGRGAFPRTKLYDAGLIPGEVVAVDLDGDGRSDLIAGEGQAVGTRLGRPDGTLGALNSIPATGPTGPMAVLDANEDGRMDLALGLADSARTVLLLGNGDGSFQAPLALPFHVGSDLVAALVAADFDGDGHVDLAADASFGASVMFGDGHGHFAAPQAVDDSGYPRDLTVGDTDGNGRLELITSDYQPPGFHIFQALGSRTLEAPDATPIAENYASLAAGDINGDGRADVLFVGPSSNALGLALSTGGGRFRPVRQFAASGPGTQVIVTDLNNDARVDVVTITTGPAFTPPWQLSIWLGNTPFECR